MEEHEDERNILRAGRLDAIGSEDLRQPEAHAEQAGRADFQHCSATEARSVIQFRFHDLTCLSDWDFSRRCTFHLAINKLIPIQPQTMAAPNPPGIPGPESLPGIRGAFHTSKIQAVCIGANK